jgi:hypothetical protein
MKTYGGMEVVIAPPFLTSALDEVSGQLHAQALYPQRTNPQYPLDRRTDGPLSQPGCCREEKNLLSLPGIEG